MIELRHIDIGFEHTLLKEEVIQIKEGITTLIQGESGSGKSSLIYRLCLMSDDKDYQYLYHGKDLTQLDDDGQAQFRRETLSYCLQDGCLFEGYDVLGNLELYSSYNNKQYELEDYERILHLVNLDIPMHQSIETLSGGQKQRLSIACLLCKDTPLIILDEPSSALDKENEIELFTLLHQISQTHHKTIIYTSHSELAKDYVDEVYSLKDTRLVREKTGEDKEVVESDHETLSPNFYKSYLTYFMHTYRMHEIVNTVFLTILTLLLSLSYTLIDYYANKSIEGYESLSENQIYIYENKPFTYTAKSHESVHPYVETYAIIDGQVVSVYPLYLQNKIDEKLLSSNEKGYVYMSYNLYSETSPLVHENADIEFYCIEDKKPVSLSHTRYDIKGVVTRGVTSGYNEKETNYLYVEYDQLDKMYEKAHVSKYQGYTLLFPDFVSFDDYKSEYQCIRFFKFGSEIRQITRRMRIIKVVIILGLFTIALVFMIYNLSKVLSQRTRELVLLKINGIHHNVIGQLLFLEVLLQSIMSFLMNVMIVLSLSFYIDISIGIILLLGLFLCLLLVIMRILTGYKVKRMSIENTLRHFDMMQ